MQHSDGKIKNTVFAFKTFSLKKVIDIKRNSVTIMITSRKSYR